MNKTILIALFIIICIAVLVVLHSSILRTIASDLTFSYRHGFERQRNIMVPMRDGTRLNTMVFKQTGHNGPLPTILMRSTYGAHLSKWVRLFIENGYAVVLQNVRGRNGSKGDYTVHQHSRNDGYDTIDWIIEQAWSNGKVGTFGCSFLGENQIILSAAKHPNHIAMIANAAGGAIGKAQESYGYFGIYENGVLNLATALGWFTAESAVSNKQPKPPEDYPIKIRSRISELPVVQLAEKVVPYRTRFEDYVTRSLTDDWWEKQGYISEHDTFATAALHVNTWYDQTIHDTFRLSATMAEKARHPRANHQYILIDPGNHCSAGELKTGLVRVGEMQIEYTDPDFRTIYLDWFDYWLKDKQDKQLPPRYHFFLIHGNKWMASSEWPPENVLSEKLFLQKDSSLKPTMPSHEWQGSRIEYDQYTYNPFNPVPTRGGPVCCTSNKDDFPGAVDQSPLKLRNDVLVYNSEKFSFDTDLIGNVKATLFVSTNALDTDFTVKLVDQYPSGAAFNIQDGVVRLRYRNGIDAPELAEPGKVYKIQLVLRPTAYRIKKGHQLSLYISSSNFPRLARNLNTGDEEYTSKRVVTSKNTIYYSNKYPSYIEIPIFPR